jgi:hypothetical protein
VRYIRDDLPAAEDIVLGHNGKIRDIDKHVHGRDGADGERGRALDSPHGVAHLRERIVCI